MAEQVSTLQDRRPKAVIFMVLASFLFAAMTLCVRLGCSRLPPLETVFVRGFLNSLVIIAILRSKQIGLFGENRKALFIRGTLGSVGVTCLFTSVLLIPVADAISLFRCSALFMPFIAWALLGEHLKLQRVLLAILGFLGATMVLKPGFNSFSLGGVIALIGSLANGFAFASIRKLSDREHPLVIMLAFLGMSALYALVLSGHNFLMPTPIELGYLLLLSTVGLLGQYAVTLAYSFAPAGVIAPWSYTEIAWSLCFGMMFLGQFPDVLSIFGTLLLVAAAVAVTKT